MGHAGHSRGRAREDLGNRLGGRSANLEILGDRPAPGRSFTPVDNGFVVLDHREEELYAYFPSGRRLSSIALELPEVRIGDDRIEVGTNVFQGNMVSGFGVGIAVTENGIGLGAPLPEGLAPLVV